MSGKPLNLALQGGGSHGAFTWGVLDRLLEDGRIGVEGVSGASAGAMNAVVLAHGLSVGGFEGARAGLDAFWGDVGKVGEMSPLQRSPIDRFMGEWSLDFSPAYLFMDMVSRVASPYDLNPLNLNPLRDILEAHVDFARLRHDCAVRLFIAATNVETGRVRVFRNEELTADMAMASACLPFLFQAVEIDGTPYWDGGYMGNPPLHPFFGQCQSDDILLVRINPFERKGAPKTAREILNRINEITFNASLMRELRAIDFVDRLIEAGRLDSADYAHIRIHSIAGESAMRDLSASSKLNAEPAFLEMLKGLGRDAASAWLETCYDKVGKTGTVDVRSFFADSPPRLKLKPPE